MVGVYVIICKLLAKPECESQGGGELGTSNFCRCFVAGSTGTQLIPVNSSTPRYILSNMHSITEPESLAWNGFSQVPQSNAVGEPDWVNSGSMSTEPYLLIKDDLAFNVPFNLKATLCSGQRPQPTQISEFFQFFITDICQTSESFAKSVNLR